jgi:xanthine dehydrogenase accessory factor
MIVDPNETVERYCRDWDGRTPYARATIVHTQGLTAAKAGAKAVITSAGDLIGWIGGGCMRRAVMRAARQAMDTATPRLIRVRPREEISVQHDPDGVELHSSSCPSKGRAEIFIEPIMPKPPLVIIGQSEIAHALADFAASLDVEVIACGGWSQATSASDWQGHARLSRGFIIIATQGAGDAAALTAALQAEAPYVAFIASRAKARAMRERLAAEGVAESTLARLRTPAGLDIGAKTASEIAIAILAEIISVRRQQDKR